MPITRPRTSSSGARILAPNDPMASPRPAGTAAAPRADAATWRLTARVVPIKSPAPTRCAVVRVSSGKIGPGGNARHGAGQDTSRADTLGRQAENDPPEEHRRPVRGHGHARGIALQAANGPDPSPSS